MKQANDSTLFLKQTRNHMFYITIEIHEDIIIIIIIKIIKDKRRE